MDNCFEDGIDDSMDMKLRYGILGMCDKQLFFYFNFHKISSSILK